jgi:hypothetical protein
MAKEVASAAKQLGPGQQVTFNEHGVPVSYARSTDPNQSSRAAAS